MPERAFSWPDRGEVDQQWKVGERKDWTKDKLADVRKTEFFLWKRGVLARKDTLKEGFPAWKAKTRFFEVGLIVQTLKALYSRELLGSESGKQIL